MSDARRALVTGATGYVGTHLCVHLADLGWDVHALRRTGSVIRTKDEARVTWHRIKADLSNLDQIIGAIAPGVVFNLAATPPGDKTADDGQSSLARLEAGNIDLPKALARTLSRRPRGVLVHAASWWEWDADGAPHTPETAPNAYARTKIVGRHILDDAAGRGALSLATLVVHDTYGPHDWRGKVLNMLIKSALSGEHCALSPGEQSMDLVHVHDVVRAFAKSAEIMMESPQSSPSVWAITSGERQSLRTVAAAVEAAVGKKLNITWGAQPYRPGTPMAIGAMAPPPPDWRPSMALADGLGALAQEERQSDKTI